MGRLEGKIALITGGAKGLGEADCRLFAKEGASVIIADVDPDARAVAEDINGTFMHLDVSDEDNWKQVVADIRTEFGALHILVNNAGIVEAGHILNTSLSSWRRVNAVSSDGTFLGCQNCIPLMIESGGGSIINMASIASSVGISDRFAYSMTKGAVLTMTYSVAKDYLKEGIRYNCISPARVHTPFVDNFIAKNYPGKEKETFAKLSATQPIGRMGKPQEIADMALFLASDEASFITGTDFPIDGGFIKLNG